MKDKKKKGQNDESEQLKAQLARTLADYDNLRKRIEVDKGTWEKIAASKVVLRLLPVFDMTLEAQKHLKDTGLEIVIGEFRKTLFDLGVEELKIEIGDEFNPLEQEVSEMIEGEKQNTIAEVVQTGWKIKGEAFIIRPARVKVFKINN